MSFISPNTVRTNKKSSYGFTIVELLIVIVIIAILAAITIVAYNGIQNRAKASAAQTAASQAARKVLAWSAQNLDACPGSLTIAEVTNQTGLQYTPDVNSTPCKFGITATSGNVSYYVSDQASNPKEGGYPGHGVGGVAAIKNYVTKPRGEATAPWDNYTPSGSATATTGSVTGLPSGNVTTAYRYAATATTSGGPYINLRPLYTATGPMTASVYVRSSTAIPIRIQVEPYNSVTGGARSTIASGNIVTLSPNVWTRLSVQVPFDAAYPYYVISTYPTAAIASGTVLFATAAMLTEGSTLYDYADGDSSGWAWSGTVNNSQSSGPPTP